MIEELQTWKKLYMNYCHEHHKHILCTCENIYDDIIQSLSKISTAKRQSF